MRVSSILRNLSDLPIWTVTVGNVCVQLYTDSPYAYAHTYIIYYYTRLYVMLIDLFLCICVFFSLVGSSVVCPRIGFGCSVIPISVRFFFSFGGAGSVVESTQNSSTIIVTAKAERLSPPNNQHIRNQAMPSQPSTPLQQPQPNNGKLNGNNAKLILASIFIFCIFCFCIRLCRSLFHCFALVAAQSERRYLIEYSINFFAVVVFVFFFSLEIFFVCIMNCDRHELTSKVWCLFVSIWIHLDVK